MARPLRLLPASLALAFAAAVPVFGQPLTPERERALYDAAREMWERELTPETRAELDARWAAIAERGAALKALVDALPENDPRRARLQDYIKAQENARTQGSGTLRGSHGARPGTDGVSIGVRNFRRADALVSEWARSGVPMTVERIQELNRVLGDGLQHNGRPPGTMRAARGEDITAGGRFRYVPGTFVGEAMAEYSAW